MEFIVSQIFVVLSYVFLALTYSLKNRKLLLIFSVSSSFTLIVGYYFLGAYTGVATSVFAAIRTIILSLNFKFKNQKLYDNILFTLFLIAITLIAIFTFEGFYSLFAIASTYLFTYAIWQKNITLYKILGIPVSLFYMLYNIFIQSWFGLACESILLVFIIIQLIIHLVQNYNKKNSNKLKNIIEKEN